MESKRLVLAVVLMMAVVFIVNVFFPPTPPRRRAAGQLGDTTAATPGLPASADTLAPARETRADRDFRALGVTGEAEPPAGEDTVWVNGPLYRLGFAKRGARLVVAELPQYESLAPGNQGQPVQLIPAGASDVLSHRLVVGQDTLDLRRVPFEIEPSSGIELRERSGEQQLRFVYEHPEIAFRVQLSYTFRPGSYVIELQANLQGVPATGYWLIGLPPGLVSNEADPVQDYKANLAFAAHGPGRDETEKLDKIEPGERKILDGPFDWVAVRTKYFVTAIVLPLDAGSDSLRFAGLLVTGDTADYRAHAAASFPVGEGRFAFNIYIGPQDHGRLSAVGRELEQVTPYGWGFIKPIIRPLVGAITGLMLWSHKTLSLSYGWVLILFGVAIRVVLFPLYQKSMRSQMVMMRVQPLMKELQTKYKGDPQRLQQETMKLYKEHKANPLGGCLPMLLPFPILIALFFVFRDTIEFRGVPFLWMPDLSQPDPLFIVPVLMGASLFLLQWIGQRGMPPNPQMKMMMWIMPVIMIVFFYKFASGINLYYATMNLASLPQQLYVARERRAAAAQAPVVKAKT